MREAIVLAAYHGPGVHQHYESLRAVHPLNIATVGQCPIDSARSFLLQVAMEQTSCEVFVFVDSDVSFQPAGYQQIVRSCLETQAVVSGCYLTKSLQGKQALAGVLTDQDQEVEFFEGGGLVPARVVPMGFTAIHRSAVGKIISSGQAGEKCTFMWGLEQQIEAYPLFMPMISAGIYQSEDYAFSHRAKAAGVDLFFDTRPRLQHYGPHGHRITDLKLVSQDYQSAAISFRSGSWRSSWEGRTEPAQEQPK